MDKKRIELTPGLLGGTDYYIDGVYAGHSEPGLFGGEDLYDRNGVPIGHSTPDILGTKTYKNLYGETIMTAVDSPFGGRDIFSREGQVGWGHQNLYGDGETIDFPSDFPDSDW